MPSVLWLTDRSRYVDGVGFCRVARFLGYHFGPTGYGIQRKGTSLPLMTGIGGHEGLAPILEYCAETYLTKDQISLDPSWQPVPDEVIRAAILGAQQRYWKVIEARGFGYMKDEPGVQELTREQCYLIEGMIWAWVLEVLPEVLRRGRIVEVEHDDTYVVGCTCGLGDGILSKADHEARDCEGIGLQCKPDFLVLTWDTTELEYHEFKTTAMDSPTFRDKWEVMIQMFAATLDAERRHGKQVGSVYVHALIKGKREGEYNTESGKRDGTIRQSSPFCYGYRKPAVPPMEPEDWKPSYDYYDQYEQKWKRVGKAYKKTGVWELPDEVVPAGLSKGEAWVKTISSEVRRKQLLTLGPFTRQEIMVPGFLQELIGEEQRWQEALWQLYEKAEQLGEGYWPHPDYQQLLQRLIPKSHECRRYGLRHACQFEEICFKREGWADPLATGRFIPRRPHHQDELQQAIGRGLLLPEEGAGEDEEREL